MSNTVLNDVTFAYVKIQSPVNKYQSNDTEFTVDCVVSKAEAKAWNKQFPKQKAKEVENDDFVEKFKMDLPFPEQDEQFIIKLKKPDIKNGKQLDLRYRPRVFQSLNGKPVDITFDVLVANGSKGKASYTVRTNDYGTFAQLDAILVDDLVEYKSTAIVGGVFGVTELAEAPNMGVVNKQTDASDSPQDDELIEPPKAKAKPAKAPVSEPEDFDTDIPF